MIAPDSTVIHTLRIKTAASDRLAARQQTERALQAASFRPIGLPRDAILIVRHLTARRMGRAGWEQPVNAELDQLARQAAHPIEGAVPANAQAVIFADRAELLACLAADWCAGVVRAQWWWQSLLRGDEVTRAVIEAWLAAPEVIPRALQRLATRQQAIAFVQRLGTAHTRSLLSALVQTFGLYQLSRALDEIDAMEPTDREVITTRPVVAQSAPWHRFTPTTGELLSADRQMLLGVGLMLHVAPSIVRSASFASEVKAWHTAIHLRPPQQRVPVESTSLSSAAPSSSTTTEPTPSLQIDEPRNMLRTQTESSITSAPSLRGALFATKQSLPEQSPQPILGESEVPPSTAPQKTAASLGTRDVPEIEPMQFDIETDFGGVCYFINLGLFLNLYGDFTTPLQPGLDLPIWDFMALVAQELIGDDVTRDPIWPLLAQLADRTEDVPPGAHFDPTRNVIASPAGAKQSPTPTTEIASSQTSLTCPAPVSGVAMTPPDRWLTDLMSLIRPRLQLALGVSADELPRYFTQRARLVVSALNFDAYFALADLPIEIRLSGLDRDPGWVPAAGRTVRFHYD